MRFFSKRAFTLVEVMVAAAILSFGVVMLYNAFFICSDSITHASNRLNAQLWIQNKIWQERESILTLGMDISANEAGTEEFNYRTFDWQKTTDRLDEGLLRFTLMLNWKEAARNRKLTYYTYFSS